MKYVCPKCGSENIIPLYAKDSLWRCINCGYLGKPHTINPGLEEFWNSFKLMTPPQK